MSNRSLTLKTKGTPNNRTTQKHLLETVFNRTHQPVVYLIFIKMFFSVFNTTIIHLFLGYLFRLLQTHLQVNVNHVHPYGYQWPEDGFVKTETRSQETNVL
jgi:hypothetical protein